jgi:hypothetical protein
LERFIARTPTEKGRTMSKTEHDKHIAGAGDDTVRKGHPALDDKKDPPERTRDGAGTKPDPDRPKQPRTGG